MAPQFPLGQIVATPNALRELEQHEGNPIELLVKHVCGDWGLVDQEDKATNDLAVEEGDRVLSAYRLSTGVKIWIITEGDRSVTTILLPEDY